MNGTTMHRRCNRHLVTITLLVAGLLLPFIPGLARISQAQDTPEIPDSCVNVITNGDMEDDNGWRVSVAPIPARYTDAGRADSRGLLLGPTNAADARGLDWSSALQEISMPESERLIFSLWYRVEQGAAAGDRVQIALLDEEFEILDYLLTDMEPADTWRSFSADISEYAGQTVHLFFGVRSDGATGTTRLYVDDVQLCDAQRVAARLAPTPTEQETRFSLAQPDPIATDELPAATAAATQPAATARPTATAVATPAAADTLPVNNETNVDTQPVDSNIISFNQLGITDLTLQGPFDARTVTFSLPAHWEIDGDGTLQLDIASFLADADADVDTESLLASGAALALSLNGRSLRTVPIDTFGQDGANVPVPAAALRDAEQDGRQVLRVVLESGPACTVDKQLGVVVGSSSRMVLPHTIVAPPTDLTMLPRPIFQGSLAPDTAVIVIPDAPSTSDLQAAFTVAAGFGRMSEGELNIEMSPVSDLTTDMRNTHHLILVGTAASLPLLNDLTLPAPAADGGFQLENATPDDGILQMVVSPWNAEKVVLVVSGNNETAVIKSAQAASTGTVRVGAQPDLALVADVRAEEHIQPIVTDRSFEAMGYPTQTLAGGGEQSAIYRFTLPAQHDVNGDAYLNLLFNHSALIDYDRSGAVVLLNGQPIRSLNFNNESAQLSTLRITLPRSTLRYGINELEVRSQLVPTIGCNVAGQSNLWFTIWPESQLHIPVDPMQGANVLTASLGDIPSTFAASTALDNTALVVSSDDSRSWDVAGQIATYLGQHTGGDTIDLAVAFSDNVPENVRNERNLIVVGRPDSLALLNEISDALLVSLATSGEPGTERGLDVVYRLPQDTNVGYLEVIPAPWNERRTILAVLGTTNAGLQRAGNALTDPNLRQDLAGTFAVIDDTRILTSGGNTPGIAGPGSAAMDQTEPASPAATQIVARPSWVLPLIVISVILIIGIAGYILFLSRRRQSLARP